MSAPSRRRALAQGRSRRAGRPWLGLQPADGIVLGGSTTNGVVVDPRRTEPARRADAWLQVRPGTDGALALGIAGAMIERGWFDEPFVREWTNGPLLVRSDTGRLLTEAELSQGGDPGRYVAWDRPAGRPAVYDPARGRYENFMIGNKAIDPISGSVPHRAYLCEIRSAEYPRDR